MNYSIVCSIITIGDELLIGQTIDTNSDWIAKELNLIGIQIKRRIAVGDNKEDILQALNEEKQHAAIIILTGGLGPTSDDITKPLLCEYFNTNLREDKKVLQHVMSLFEKRKRPVIESNIMQAWVPANCTVLFNEMGTAPGMLFNHEGIIYISLPGVPFEMEYIMTAHVIPFLKNHFKTENFIHKTLITFGLGESFLAERLKEFEKKLPPSVRLAYLPAYNVVKLRLTAYAISNNELDKYVSLLKNEIEDILIADEDISLEQALMQILSQYGLTISTAESCTGGLIASRITSIKGSSQYFKGSVVAYSEFAKTHLLDVSKETITQFTAVSKETVSEMAQQCNQKFATDFAIAISGYLEKGDHQNEVWIGVASKNFFEAKQFFVYGDRKRNTEFATNYALYFLRKCILKSINT